MAANKNGAVIPKRLAMLEYGSEISLEIVLPDEDAQKIGIAQRAENVPGQRRCAKYGDDQRMQETKWRAPLARKRGPQQRRASRENYRRRPFRQYRGAEKKSERDAQQRARASAFAAFR